MNRWKKCWEANPEIYMLLRGSSTLEEARKNLIRYLEDLDWSYRKDVGHIQSWDYILLMKSVLCFKNIISPRNEGLAQQSTLKFLWQAARGGDAEVKDGFVEELYHLFRAITQNAEVYPPSFLDKRLEYLNIDTVHGRKSGILRSNYLDSISENVTKWIKRYPSGLQAKIIQKRKDNKKHILDILGGSEDEWLKWQWHFKHVFKKEDDLEILKSIIQLTSGEEEGILLALKNNVPFGVTPYYLHLLDPIANEYDYAVRRQVFPPVSYVQKMVKLKTNRKTLDFMREEDTSPIDIVTRRYPKVAILKPYDSCIQICVYCQRNWEIIPPFMPGAMASREKLDAALQWFAAHPEIMDVLVTGGDPLVMNDQRIEYILEALAEIPHIHSIRIATRMPVVLPMRITNDFCELLGRYYEVGKQTLCMVTHVEHPYEVTPEMAEVVKRVKMQGMHVYNQEVFTFANSRRFETVALRIAIKQIGIAPYYTFNMKGKTEMLDYAAPIARLIQERKEEARLLPGIFRTDKSVFNVPFLGKNHVYALQDHSLIAILPDGRRMYSFHPWEKNLSKVNSYIYTDICIQDYLENLKDRGENPVDYNSIWYYY